MFPGSLTMMEKVVWMLYYVWKGRKTQAEPPGGKCGQRESAREGDDAVIESEHLSVRTRWKSCSHPGGNTQPPRARTRSHRR